MRRLEMHTYSNGMKTQWMISKDKHFEIRKKNMLQFDVIFFSFLFLSQQKMNPLNGSNLNSHICMHNSNCNFMRLFLIDDWNGKSPAVRPQEQASCVLNYAFCVFLSIFSKSNCITISMEKWRKLNANCAQRIW